MINRPTREVDPQDVIRQIERALANTGYEEISLLSLSTADYSYIGELLMGINELLQGTSISLSYPSLRPDAFTREMAESIIGGRKTSLTFAPEAGSERLRASINKDLKDEDLFQALQIAKDEGWRSAKLYFMVGLPGESDTDVEALVKLARKSRDILCSSPKKPLHISVSVFSPKPHTGFQRAELIESEDIIRRIRMIKRGLGSPNFKISIHQHEMSKVETLLARGDRRLGKVIERVFKSGARFEGWSDRFDYNRWDVAMEEEGLDWKWFIGAKSEDENLSWSHISTGIKEEFLVQEWRRAQDGVLTPDCRDKCSRCGKECPPPPRSKLRSSILTKRDALKAVEPKLKVRFKFTRTGPACFCSQLETAKIIERTLRRAKLPVAFSLGFHPHPKMSFGPALPLGYESKGEYFDVGLLKMDEEDVVRLREAVYGGIEIQSGRMIDWSVPSLGNSVNYLKHYVQLHLIKPGLLELIEDLKNGKPLLTMNRKGEVWEISKFIRRMELYGKELQYEVEILVGKYPRLETILIKAGYEKYEMGLISRECFRFTDGKIKEL
jgi:radical SAM-linked protein